MLDRLESFHRGGMTTACVLVLCALAAAPAGGQEAAVPAATSAAEAAVDAYVALWGTDDLSALDAVVTPGFTRHARPGESPASAAELADLVRHTRANFDHVRIEVTRRFCDGDRCALAGHFIGRVPGSDRGVRMPTTAFYRLEDGRVAEEWVTADQLPSMFGLGYQLAPPGFGVAAKGPDDGPVIVPPDQGGEE